MLTGSIWVTPSPAQKSVLVPSIQSPRRKWNSSHHARVNISSSYVQHQQIAFNKEELY